MKLKKTWLGYGIWGIYTIFTIFLIAYAAYGLDLLPADQKIAYTAVFTVLSIAVVGVLALLICKLHDYFFKASDKDDKLRNILFVIISVVIMILALVYRIFIVYGSSATLNGNLYLYESAQIGNDVQISKADLLSFVYSNILRFILGFTGNSDIVVPMFQVSMQMLMLVAMFFAVLLTMGRVAAIAETAYFAFVPVFVNDFYDIYAKNLFYLLFALELLIFAIYIKGESDGLFSHPASFALFAFAGISGGFMFYIDAGTIMAVVFLIAALFVADKKIVQVLLHLLTLVICGAVTFALMLLQQGGISGFASSFSSWHTQFFKSLSTLALFTFYYDYKYMYLVTMILMGIAVFTYFRGGRIERVSPWLLLTVLMAVIIPFLGSTRLNSQLIVTLFYGVAISAGISCITLIKKTATVENIDDEDIVSEESCSEGEEMIIKPVEIPAEERVVKPVEIKTSASKEKITEAEKEVKSDTTEEIKKDIPSEDNKEKKGEKVRYVPEGMVVPMGQEDEEDFVAPTKMKMPEFKDDEPIAIKRHPKEKGSSMVELKKKDDFAIDIKSGDDFAI